MNSKIKIEQVKGEHEPSVHGDQSEKEPTQSTGIRSTSQTDLPAVSSG